MRTRAIDASVRVAATAPTRGGWVSRRSGGRTRRTSAASAASSPRGTAGGETAPRTPRPSAAGRRGNSGRPGRSCSPGRSGSRCLRNRWRTRSARPGRHTGRRCPRDYRARAHVIGRMRSITARGSRTHFICCLCSRIRAVDEAMLTRIIRNRRIAAKCDDAAAGSAGDDCPRHSGRRSAGSEARGNHFGWVLLQNRPLSRVGRKGRMSNL